MRKLVRNGSRKLSLLGIVKFIHALSVGRFAISRVCGGERMMKINEVRRYIETRASNS